MGIFSKSEDWGYSLDRNEFRRVGFLTNLVEKELKTTDGEESD